MELRKKAILMFGACLLSASAWAGNVSLIPENGEAKCVIAVDAPVMVPKDQSKGLKNPALEEEKQRQRLRDSVKDLALYLKKMTGKDVSIVTTDQPIPAGKLPIYIGAAAKKKFGDVGKTAPFKQAFRIVVDGKKGIGLYGESALADSYAIYTLLDQLGCRWFFSGKLGEVIPQKKEIVVKEQDLKDAPYTYYRGGSGYSFDEKFMRQARMGGVHPPTQHCLEGYISKDEKKKHPEWIAEFKDGRPMNNRLKWSNKALAERIGEVIESQQKTNPRYFFCLSPDDGAVFDQSKADEAIDAGDFDPTFQMISITDRALTFYNRIVERAVKNNPDLLFSALAYVQYTRPPKREKPHKNLVIQIAPITYSRAHPMDRNDVPDNETLRYIVEGWGKVSNAISYYFYGYFLADPVSTNPFLRKWAVDIPAIYKKGSCRYWQPETMGNNEFFAMAQWMAQRMAWNPDQDPWKLYREANDALYGRAKDTMWKFWNEVDLCWFDSTEYSGAAWGHLRRFSPERVESINKLAAQALKEAPDGDDGARVKFATDSWKITTDFVNLRKDLAEGRWSDLNLRSEAWKKHVSEKAIGSGDNRCYAWCWFGKDKTFAGQYYDWFYSKTHKSAERIAKECTILVEKPIREFRYSVEAAKDGLKPETAAVNFNDSSWKKTDVATDTWSHLGYHNHMGSMWYRTTVDLKSIPSDKKIYLWIGGTDGSIAAFVNGKAVKGAQDPKFDPKKLVDIPSGYGTPLRFDITDAVKKGKNVFAFFATRGPGPNEIGTGGIMSPLTVFVENK